MNKQLYNNLTILNTSFIYEGSVFVIFIVEAKRIQWRLIMNSKKIVVLLVVLILSITSLAGCNNEIAENGEDTGNGNEPSFINILGSDTMVNLGQSLAEVYMDEVNPLANIAVTGGGSGTGIAALINDNVDIAQSSRSISATEIEQASDNNVEVFEFVMGQDGLAVVVSEDNPISNLTFAQLKSIFTGEILNWSELGWENGGEISVFSRQSNSGTYVFFNTNVMDGEDWAPNTLFLPGSSSIAEALLTDNSGIGYFGVGYVQDGLKAINVAIDESSDYITPLVKENVDTGLYPIARPLFFYTNGAPSDEVLAYLEWVLSEDGQKVVGDTGFYAYTPVYHQMNEDTFRKAGLR